MSNNFEKNVFELVSIDKTEKTAKILYNKILENSKQGEAESSGYLAFHHFTKDQFKEATKFAKLSLSQGLEKKAANNEPDALYVIGLINGFGILNDGMDDIAFFLKTMKKAVEKGSKLAIIELGYYHFHIAMEGDEKSQNKELKKSENYFLKAVEMDVIEAYVSLGELYQEIGDIDKAIEFFEKGAKKGDSNGYFGLGISYLELEKYEEAKINFEKSVEMEHPVSAFHLGALHYEIYEDIETALYYFEISAKAGFPDALFDLGLLYYEGDLVKKNSKKAFKYFEEASQYGDAASQFYLGVCYYEGIGVKKDKEKALKWIEAAAEAGDDDAIEMLSLME